MREVAVALYAPPRAGTPWSAPREPPRGEAPKGAPPGEREALLETFCAAYLPYTCGVDGFSLDVLDGGTLRPPTHTLTLPARPIQNLPGAPICPLLPSVLMVLLRTVALQSTQCVTVLNRDARCPAT